SFSSSSSCLIDELLLGKLSETVVIVGNAPYGRPGFLVVRLIGNRASFLCTEAPMRRVQKIVSGHQLTSISVLRTNGLGEAVISADRARRFDTLRAAPA